MSNSSEHAPCIRSLEPGDAVTGFFVIRRIELKTRKQGKPFLHLELGDASGRITANIWENASEQYEVFAPGALVKVQGSASTYNGKIQLSIQKIRLCTESDYVTPAMFIPSKPMDLKALEKNLMDLIYSVTDPWLKKLLSAVFEKETVKSSFPAMAGGKLWHHAYVGGLMEHTVSVAAICETMAERYSRVNRDLLITGALLHDIGKVFEYSFETGFIDFTDYGRLVGHISIGTHFVAAIIEEMDSFPIELKHQVMHLILSHQGKHEHGSPVLPATLEAMILYYADEMDSKANALTHIIERDQAPGRSWSQYINLLDRFIYLSPGKNHAGDSAMNKSHAGSEIEDSDTRNRPQEKNSTSDTTQTLFDL